MRKSPSKNELFYPMFISLFVFATDIDRQVEMHTSLFLAIQCLFDSDLPLSVYMLLHRFHTQHEFIYKSSLGYSNKAIHD